MGLFDKASDVKVFPSISGPEMTEIVREMGFVPELSADSGGDPLIRFGIEGLKCAIFFYGYKEGRSDSLQFSAGFSNKPALTKVNEWNSKKRFGKAHLDTDGDVRIQMDVDIDGGVTTKYLQEILKRWRSVLTGFVRFMSE